MSQRIGTLTRYLWGQVFFSLSGLLYVIAALAYWRIFFSPTEGQTPEADMFILLVGLFGGVLTFLVTLTTAGRANLAASYPLLARLPSRVEYLAAVLLAALLYSTLVQLSMGLIIVLQPGGPNLSLGRLLDIPPLWFSINIFAATLALHAADLVMKNWSRVWVYGVLTLLLFSQSINIPTVAWFAARLRGLANIFYRRNWSGPADAMNNAASWLALQGAEFLRNTLGFIFWPLQAMAEATKAGSFTRPQALAPAILLLYATILFMLAADFFATKDLHLAE